LQKQLEQKDPGSERQLQQLKQLLVG